MLCKKQIEGGGRVGGREWACHQDKCNYSASTVATVVVDTFHQSTPLAEGQTVNKESTFVDFKVNLKKVQKQTFAQRN